MNVWQALASSDIKGRYKRALCLRALHSLKFREIGETLGVCGQRAHDIVNNAIRVLQQDERLIRASGRSYYVVSSLNPYWGGKPFEKFYLDLDKALEEFEYLSSRPRPHEWDPKLYYIDVEGEIEQMSR